MYYGMTILISIEGIRLVGERFRFISLQKNANDTNRLYSLCMVRGNQCTHIKYVLFSVLAFLFGSYCCVPTTYGNMMLLSTSIQRSKIICLSKCSLNSACLGVNFNKETNECELVSGGQTIHNISRQDWSFYLKC